MARKKSLLFRSFEEAFPDEYLSMEATNYSVYSITNNALRKDECSDTFCHYHTLRWYSGDDTVAIMKLNTLSVECSDQLIAFMDEISEDSYVNAAAAIKYARMMKFVNWMTEDDLDKVFDEHDEDFSVCMSPITYCDIENFYISPKYRGKGLSAAFFMTLGNYLRENGINQDDTCISTHVNPFIIQDKDLSEDSMLNADDFGGYTYHKKGSEEMCEIMAKPLRKCGFKEVDPHFFVVDLKTLTDIGLKAHFPTVVVPSDVYSRIN